jgi:hypothetical protein
MVQCLFISVVENGKRFAQDRDKGKMRNSGLKYG